VTALRAAFLMLLVAAFVAPASAATTSKPRARSTARSTPARPAGPRAAKAAADSTKASGEGRTLGDIHIEGEIATPQVLFITARDQRRIVDLQHRRYLETSREVGERTILPSRIGPIVKPPVAGKETQR
jgi:hypothetical protein